MRPGRLDRILYVGPPDVDGRKEILRIRTTKMSVEAGLDIHKLAEVVSTICCDNSCVLTQRIDGRLLGCRNYSAMPRGCFDDDEGDYGPAELVEGPHRADAPELSASDSSEDEGDSDRHASLATQIPLAAYCQAHSPLLPPSLIEATQGLAPPVQGIGPAAAGAAGGEGDAQQRAGDQVKQWGQ